jgi:hypothetical protein
MKFISRLSMLATTCIAIGWTVVSNPAQGHPSGMVVSTGTNPIVNVAGQLSSSAWVTVMTAPADQDIVVTDLVFSANHSGAGEPELRLGSTSTTVGRYFIFGGSYNGGGPAHFSLLTGIRIPAGDSLELNINTTNYVNYSLSGYYAQP